MWVRVDVVWKSCDVSNDKPQDAYSSNDPRHRCPGVYFDFDEKMQPNRHTNEQVVDDSDDDESCTRTQRERG